MRQTSRARLDLQGRLTTLSGLQGPWIGDGSTSILSARTPRQDATVRVDQAPDSAGGQLELPGS